jgi:amidase
VVEVRRAVERTATILRELGHHVIERDPAYRPSLGVSNTVRYLTGLAEDVAALADPHATETRTRALARIGALVPSRSVAWARATGEEFGDVMAEFFGDVDALVMPTMPVLPRMAGCLAERGTVRTVAHMLPCAAYTGPWNASGLPAMNLPVGTTAGGLPVGVQLVGPAMSEPTLLSLAAAIEPVAGWFDRRVAG